MLRGMLGGWGCTETGEAQHVANGQQPTGRVEGRGDACERQQHHRRSSLGIDGFDAAVTRPRTIELDGQALKQEWLVRWWRLQRCQIQYAEVAVGFDIGDDATFQNGGRRQLRAAVERAVDSEPYCKMHDLPPAEDVSRPVSSKGSPPACCRQRGKSCYRCPDVWTHKLAEAPEHRGAHDRASLRWSHSVRHYPKSRGHNKL